MTMTPSKRWRVLQRDNFRCRYCGRTGQQAELQVDHMLPQSKGGSDGYSNLVTACVDCNMGKKAVETEPYIAVEIPLSRLRWSLDFDRYLLCEEAEEATVGNLIRRLQQWEGLFLSLGAHGWMPGGWDMTLIKAVNSLGQWYTAYEESHPDSSARPTEDEVDAAIAEVERIFRAAPWRPGIPDPDMTCRRRS